MTLPIDRSSAPVPATSSSSRRDASPARWFLVVRTLTFELSRLPFPEGVGEVLCPRGWGAQELAKTFLRFHRNCPVAHSLALCRPQHPSLTHRLSTAPV